MKTLVRFHYKNIDEFYANTDVFTLVETPINQPIKKDEIEDCISSYIDNVEDWEFESLVVDVLTSFGYSFNIINPITFEI